MKKIILLTCAILMISATANACGGITIKGNSGASYCLSKQTMNWYSAYAWCDAQKMSLIDIETVCKSYNSCPELKLSDSEKTHITDNGGTLGWMWTNNATAHNGNIISHFEFNGTIYHNANGNRTNYGYALCL